MLILQMTEARLQEIVKDALKASLEEMPKNGTKEPEPGFLSLKEAAKYLNLSEATIRNYLPPDCPKRIPHNRPTKKYQFKKEDLDNWNKSYRHE